MMFSNRVVADEILAQLRLTDLSQWLEGFTLRPNIWIDQLALDEERFVDTELVIGNEYEILLASDTRKYGIFVEVLRSTHAIKFRSIFMIIVILFLYSFPFIIIDLFSLFWLPTK